MITIKEENYGTEEWCLNGKLHRDDGPAIECTNGSKMWYRNGQRHRENGPAVIWWTGSKEWFLNGKLHRVDGPGFEWFDGEKFWYLNDKILSVEDAKKHQITRLQSISIALSPLELPPYVIFWILEWSESAYISELSQVAVIKMLEGIRNSREKIKTI